MRFVVLVEGHMERMALPKFLKKWLDLRIAPAVGVGVRNLGGKDHFRKECAKVARDLLGAPNGKDIVGVVGLLDLYDGPTCSTWYPRRLKAADERRAWAIHEMEREVGNPRFKQFFAVHETEAWLLSDPSLFPEPMRTAVAKKGRKPEAVNFREPPSAMLDALYRDHRRRGYGKTTDGPDLLGRLDPDLAYCKCPALREMLDAMLQMALAAGFHPKAG